jgi:hypothetical protein
VARRIVSLKNFSYTIGNGTLDLPACSSVPQPNAPPRAPYDLFHLADIFYSKKGKAIPAQAWTGPEASRSFGLPDFKKMST